MLKIIFCAFNEGQNLKKLLVNLGHELQLLQRDYEIVACLDGSSDDSASIIADFQKFHPIRILPIKNQRGLGLAYKRLFEEAIANSQNEDLIISLDADNTHNPEQIPEMIRYFDKHNLDLLIASRFCDKSMMADFPIYRKFISRSISVLLQNLFPIKKISGEKLKDFTSGYRIYKAEKLKKLFEVSKNKFITEPEFTYTCELVIKLSRIKSRIDEVAISYDYGEKMGKSKLRIFRNFIRLNVLLIKLIR